MRLQSRSGLEVLIQDPGNDALRVSVRDAVQRFTIRNSLVSLESLILLDLLVAELVAGKNGASSVITV